MIAQAEPQASDQRLWTEAEFHRLKELGFFGNRGVVLQGDGTLALGSSSWRWSKGAYYRLGELGFFDGQKAELLEGEIVVTSPMLWPHAAGLSAVKDALEKTLVGAWVRTQLPVDFGLTTEPEPDVSAVPGSRQNYTSHPQTALLIVEVSDTTLARDRGRKGSLYARAGVADYWIVNLVDGQLEVFRNPIPDPSQPYGYRYADVAILTRGDAVAPLAFPGVVVAVADLLP